MFAPTLLTEILRTPMAIAVKLQRIDVKVTDRSTVVGGALETQDSELLISIRAKYPVTGISNSNVSMAIIVSALKLARKSLSSILTRTDTRFRADRAHISENFLLEKS